MRRKWTEIDDARVRQMFAIGVPMKEIAARLGRTYGSTEQRVIKLKLRERTPRRNWTESELAELASRLDAVVFGYAEHSGRNVTAVRSRAMTLLCYFQQRRHEAA